MQVCVFNASFSSAALRVPLSGGGSSQWRHTLYCQIWRATRALKETEVCECVRLFALKHEILSNVAAYEQKVHISTVFTGFAVESSSWACLMTGNCLVAVWFLVCLSVYLPLHRPSLAVSLLPPPSPRSHIPTSLYLEVCRRSPVLFFKPHLCLRLPHTKTTVTYFHTYLYTLHECARV